MSCADAGKRQEAYVRAAFKLILNCLSVFYSGERVGHNCERQEGTLAGGRRKTEEQDHREVRPRGGLLLRVGKMLGKRCHMSHRLNESFELSSELAAELTSELLPFANRAGRRNNRSGTNETSAWIEFGRFI